MKYVLNNVTKIEIDLNRIKHLYICAKRYSATASDIDKTWPHAQSSQLSSRSIPSVHGIFLLGYVALIDPLWPASRTLCSKFTLRVDISVYLIDRYSLQIIVQACDR